MQRTQVLGLIGVLVAIAVVVGLKATRGGADGQAVMATASQPMSSRVPVAEPEPAAPATAPATKPAPKGLPRLIELGSTTCIPCKKMAPILAELKGELKGKVSVEFIDIYKDTAAADKYGIQIIPTQLFLDGTGKERFRHEGFYPKADILQKLAEVKLHPTE